MGRRPEQFVGEVGTPQDGRYFSSLEERGMAVIELGINLTKGSLRAELEIIVDSLPADRARTFVVRAIAYAREARLRQKVAVGLGDLEASLLERINRNEL